jgi:hypothetical protein
MRAWPRTGMGAYGGSLVPDPTQPMRVWQTATTPFSRSEKNIKKACKQNIAQSAGLFVDGDPLLTASSRVSRPFASAIGIQAMPPQCSVDEPIKLIRNPQDTA